jgi:hypothetical protein
MADGILGLRPTLEKLARTTWMKIADGRRLGIPMGETGITDHNMLDLRRELPSLVIHKHAPHEEIRTGADWEWWLSTADGWICLVFQAKVLDAAGRYPGITKGMAQGQPQIQELLRTCLDRSKKLAGTVWPLYCFYNSWFGKWPDGVRRYDACDSRTMSDRDLQLFGCAAADAWRVGRILADKNYKNRRTLRDTYLPVSRPWSLIFPDPSDSETYSSGQTLRALSSWRYDRLLVELPPPDEIGLPDTLRRRGHTTIYEDPSPVPRLPDYVLDLIEGTPGRPRRLKPLARRTVVLP